MKPPSTFENPSVGLVTSFYQACGARGTWGLMESLSINAHFLPQAACAAAFGMRFAMGAAMMVRRQAFEASGAFLNLADHLADDFWLGESVREAGWRLETAEGCAEWLHRRIREDWGFPDAPTMTMQERFTSRYRGKRYSFGYPACPNLNDQQGIWKLLRPDDIGVRLTEEMMMDPEASVSALVFHHPDCAYFTASEVAEPVAELVAQS